MSPVERSTSTPQPLRMRVGKPGDGARLKPLWLPWLGNHFDEAMDSLDPAPAPGALVRGCGGADAGSPIWPAAPE